MTTETQASEKPTDDVSALLGAMRKGDPVSCRGFIAHFQEPLYNYLYWLCGDPDTARTLFEQTMMSVYRNLPRVRKAHSAPIWVYRQATQLYLERGKRLLAQQRSSWDNILRSGLNKGRDDKWSQWDDQQPEGATIRTAALVEAIKDLAPRERAAILLVGVLGLTPPQTAQCLQLSRRRTARVLLKAFNQLALHVSEPSEVDPTGAPKGAREKIRRQLLGTLSPGRTRKLNTTLEDNAAGEAIRREEQAVWDLLGHLPRFRPPFTLVDDTQGHLKARQEAQEVRIANWGFRFMQVTVPIFILIFIAIILLPAITRSREAARVAAGADNLHAIGEALLAYSNQSGGNKLPPMANAAGLWVPDLRVLYPRYIKDPATLVRPSLKDPELVKAMTAALTQSPPDYDRAHTLMARSYVYTGYVLLDSHNLNMFMETCRNRADLNFEVNIETPRANFIRLGKGVELFFTTDYANPEAVARTRATIPVLFETFSSIGFDKEPDGANVLYLDGHVDYVRFGTDFPVTEQVQESLSQ